MSTSQTLGRGLTALEFIASAPRAPTVDAVASHLGVHRSVAYRIVRTLEEHHLARRDASGRCLPGARLATLARSVRAPLQAVAVGELSSIANELGVTAFLVVRDGDEAVTIESIEPVSSQFHLTYKPGLRHPVVDGAPGIAILADSAPLDRERHEVAIARRRGWSWSDGEVIPGMASIAVPIRGADAAIAVVFLAAAHVDPEATAGRLMAGATAIAARLEPGHIPDAV